MNKWLMECKRDLARFRQLRITS